MQANQGSRFSSCALLYLPQAAGCCASMAFCLCAMWLCLISGMLGSYPTPLKAKMHIFLCCSSSQPALQSCCCCFWAKLMKCLPTFLCYSRPAATAAGGAAVPNPALLLFAIAGTCLASSTFSSRQQSAAQRRVLSPAVASVFRMHTLPGKTAAAAAWWSCSAAAKFTKAHSEHSLVLKDVLKAIRIVCCCCRSTIELA